MLKLLAAAPWYARRPADEAGSRSASWWPARAMRVRPPEGGKDWTEAVQAGSNYAAGGLDRLGGNRGPRGWPLGIAGLDAYAIDERAAIMEFDGGLTREAAERAPVEEWN